MTVRLWDVRTGDVWRVHEIEPGYLEYRAEGHVVLVLKVEEDEPVRWGMAYVFNMSTQAKTRVYFNRQPQNYTLLSRVSE